MTMSTEQGARDLYQMAFVDVLGSKCILEKPKDPSDIIWENQAVNVKLQFLRKVVLLLFTLFTIARFTFFISQSDSFLTQSLMNRYDLSVNC